MTTTADVIVVGAGPAGMTVATSTSARGWRTMIFDEVAPGGLLLNIGELSGWSTEGPTVRGVDVASQMTSELMASGAELVLERVRRIQPDVVHQVVTDTATLSAPIVVLASGRTSGNVGTPVASPFDGRGLSHCASCDGPLHAGRDVAVAGADEWAVQEALALAGVVASVTLIVPSDALRCSPSRARAATADQRIRIVLGTRVAALIGDDGISGIEVENLDGTGRRDLPVSGVFVYTDRRPRREVLPAAYDPPGVPRAFVVGEARSDATVSVLQAIEDARAVALHIDALLSRASG